MSIQQDLKRELIQAMKAKDTKTTGVIRMINSKIGERRTSKGFKGEVDDALYVEVIGAYRKSLLKGVEQYRAAGDKGLEHIAALEWEAAYCERFLPRLLGPEETRELVKAAVEATGADNPRMVGKVMGAVMKQHKGSVEPALVRKLALELLS